MKSKTMFKKGDRVRVIEPLNRDESPVFVSDMDKYIGKEFVVSSADRFVYLHGASYTWNKNWLVLVDDLTKEVKTTTYMATLIEKAKLAFKKEPEKSFIKVGVMDANENLTTEGKDLLFAFLLEKNKDAFKTEVVDPILKEIEAEKK